MDMQARDLRSTAEREELAARLLLSAHGASRDIAMAEVTRREVVFSKLNVSTVRTVGDPTVAALRSVLDDVIAGRL